MAGQHQVSPRAAKWQPLAVAFRAPEGGFPCAFRQMERERDEDTHQSLPHWGCPKTPDSNNVWGLEQPNLEP